MEYRALHFYLDGARMRLRPGGPYHVPLSVLHTAGNYQVPNFNRMVVQTNQVIRPGLMLRFSDRMLPMVSWNPVPIQLRWTETRRQRIQQRLD